MDVEEHLELMDWRRKIGALYASVRATQDPGQGWREWRAERDRLFREHPQSPLPPDERAVFTRLTYFDYEPAARVLARLSDGPRERYEIPTSGTSPMTFDRIATATFELGGQTLSLEVYWLEGYGGGMFVPFRDGTSGSETYGAGRYLIDSIKGADLGTVDGGLVLDFNFVFNPSCVPTTRAGCARWRRRRTRCRSRYERASGSEREEDPRPDPLPLKFCCYEAGSARLLTVSSPYLSAVSRVTTNAF